MTQTTPRATEQRNPRTRGLSAKSTKEILRAIHREDVTVAHAVARAIPSIAQAADAIAHAIENGGRLFYVGAGTSGRLASLDAAELPPTFGTPGRWVQAVVAGGRAALTRAIEGAEDDRVQGARDLAARQLTRKDIVVGITASGSTPYVLGALAYARRWGAITIGVTSNPRTPVLRFSRIHIVTPTGPEAITGSTRMKAGTAQKMVLNMLSTAAMIRMGRVYDNWMIGVAMTNRKLRDRGLRILAEASGATRAEAARALRQLESGGRPGTKRAQRGLDLCAALIIMKTGATAEQARPRLRAARGNLRAALDDKKTM